MSDDCVIVERADAVWRVRLNRPKQGNAMSAAMVEALDDALALAASEGASAVVLQGEGRHFCTGFDLSQLDSETDDTLLARFVRIELLLQRVARAPFLTVAVTQGRAMGAGADLFAACSLRIAMPEARFSFPGARGFGLVLGTRRLADCVGSTTALHWVESACTVQPDEALRAGLVSALVNDMQAADEAIATRVRTDCTLGHALRGAVSPHAQHEDARDLELLVRSAARRGLRDRIARYIAQSAR